MHKNLKVFTVVTLLAAATSVPVMCHAMADKKDSSASTAATSTEKPSPIPPGAPYSFADIADDLIPAVVNISSTLKADAPTGQDDMGQLPDMPQFPPGSPFEDFFEEFLNRRGGQSGPSEPAIPPASLGSGFVIDAAKGLIVTNNHVVNDADEVRVTFQDDTTLPAKIIGKDEKMDLAVLKVETTKKLADVKFGDSDVLRVGDWVLAIGNPFGLGGTVTAGIISAQQRNINAGPYDDFIQTDASINRGNSGGPMFNLKGEVIGINTAIFSPSGGSVGIGFAIPSNLAKSVVGQLIEFGKTRRGWIGVRIQTVTEEIAESLGLKDQHGALIASVTSDGPAAKTKLKAGDVITEFDGKKVTAMRNLPRIVAETPIDKKVEFKFFRDGKAMSDTIKVGELEKAEEAGLLNEEPTVAKAEPNKGTEVAKVGMTVATLTDTTRRAFSVPDDVNGVLVVKTDAKSEAANKGLSVGDVIVEINQQKTEKAEDITELIAKAEKEGKSSVLLLVNREGDVRFLALRLKK